MHRGQPDSGCPKAVYFPACGKPGRAPAGKRGRHTAFLRTSKGIRLTREGELLFRYVKTGVEQLLEGGRMLERMLDMDMGEVRIGASDMTLQFFFCLFGAVSQRVPTDQSYRNQCPHTRNHLQPGGRKN